MTQLMRTRLGTLAACAVGVVPCIATAAAQAPAPVQQIEVKALAHPDSKAYPKLVEGTRVFDRYRHFAPQATLRFKVHAREAGVDMHGLKLKIVGDSTSLPVTLDSELRFELPIDQTLITENADVSYNRRKGALSWRPDVRTPDTAPNTRRLGDLRLECRVDVLGAHVANGHAPLSIVMEKLSADVCNRDDLYYHFYADRPIFNVTLTYGNRTLELMSDKLYGNDAPRLLLSSMDWNIVRDQIYLVPLNDVSWPDDTVVSFEYMDDPAAPPATSQDRRAAP
jgi:hypothetical protein